MDGLEIPRAEPDEQKPDTAVDLHELMKDVEQNMDDEKPADDAQ